MTVPFTVAQRRLTLCVRAMRQKPAVGIFSGKYGVRSFLNLKTLKCCSFCPGFYIKFTLASKKALAKGLYFILSDVTSSF